MGMLESQTEACIENCPSCVHFGYCLIYWGTECKRQGGNKIPRMKSKRVEAKIQEDLKKKPKKSKNKKSNKSERLMTHKPWNKIIDIAEPIRTKVANW